MLPLGCAASRVASRIAPRTNGLKYPDRLPTELIQAMPAAAALPERIAVGSAQNVVIVDIMPAVATVRQARPGHPDRLGRPESANATAATAAPTAMCQRRSCRRSELAPTRTAVIAAAPQGIAETRPMRHGSGVIVSRMICGSQKVTP